MGHIPYETLEEAEARNKALWEAVLGREKRPDDVTEFVYGTRERTGLEEDTDTDALIPEGSGATIEVAERDEKLDTLIRADQMTAEEIAVLVVLYPDWEVGTPYQIDDLVGYDGTLYRVIQAHTSQSDWTPDVAESLFADTAPAGVIPEWVQPQGAHDAYNTGDQVTYNGQVWESTIDANVWAPGVYGWVLV